MKKKKGVACEREERQADRKWAGGWFLSHSWPPGTNWGTRGLWWIHSSHSLCPAADVWPSLSLSKLPGWVASTLLKSRLPWHEDVIVPLSALRRLSDKWPPPPPPPLPPPPPPASSTVRQRQWANGMKRKRGASPVRPLDCSATSTSRAAVLSDATG